MKYGVVGLGLTGQSVLRFLPSEQMAWGWDTRADFDLTSSRALTQAPLYAGELPEQAWEEVDALIVSPGIPVDDPALAPARARGLPIWGDIELFAQQVNQPVIAITGSNGKSTVTTLVAEMLKAAGIKAVAGGNLGTPALDLLHQPADVYVLELSSFQLETTYSLAPQTATVLNISEDHLDRYPDMAAYAVAKRRILEKAHMAVLPDELADWALPEQPVVCFGLRVPARDTDFGVAQGWLVQGDSPLFPIEQMAQQSRHMQLNALAALALITPFVDDLSLAAKVLHTFSGLLHRTELVAHHQGVRWINDSKGTNVGATLAALESFLADGPVILIAGGVGKGQDFTPLAEPMAACKAVILFGRDAPKLAAACMSAQPLVVETLPQALEVASQHAEAGDTVLFSPACASFDQFANYQARGDAFKQWVNAHVSK